LSSILQIKGQIHHHVRALLPPVNADHKFLQIYFLGNSDDEINQRCAIAKSCGKARDYWATAITLT